MSSGDDDYFEGLEAFLANMPEIIGSVVMLFGLYMVWNFFGGETGGRLAGATSDLVEIAVDMMENWKFLLVGYVVLQAMPAVAGMIGGVARFMADEGYIGRRNRVLQRAQQADTLQFDTLEQHRRNNNTATAARAGLTEADMPVAEEARRRMQISEDSFNPDFHELDTQQKARQISSEFGWKFDDLPTDEQNRIIRAVEAGEVQANNYNASSLIHAEEQLRMRGNEFATLDPDLQRRIQNADLVLDGRGFARGAYTPSLGSALNNIGGRIEQDPMFLRRYVDGDGGRSPRPLGELVEGRRARGLPALSPKASSRLGSGSGFRRLLRAL